MITRNGHGNLLGASGGGATTVAIDRTGTALDEVKLSALLSLKDKADTTAGRGRCV